MWTIILLASSSVYCSSNIIYFGACRFLSGFCEDFHQTIEELDQAIKVYVRLPSNARRERLVEIKRAFGRAIGFHANIREFSFDNIHKGNLQESDSAARRIQVTNVTINTNRSN